MTKRLSATLALGLLLTSAPVASAAAEQQDGCHSLKDTVLTLGQAVRFKPGKAFLVWRANLKTAPGIFINGYHLDAEKIQLVEINPTCYAFNLNRSVMTGDLWTSVRNRDQANFLNRNVALAFGDATDLSPSVPVEMVTLRLIRPNIFWGWIGFFLFLLLAMLVLGFKSDLLKEKGADGKTEIFSLAKTQMAFWFFVVALSLVFVWIITGGVSELNPSVLVLMGISSVTFVSASLLGTDSNPDDVKKALLATEVEKKAQKSFILQILSDHQGVRLHRFQMLGWTLIFGIIFLTEVVSNLVLPDFGGTILGLMGISSATYLGHKFPEVNN